ncbi:unnamed protein product [Closterium sp. NIES-65]|nr:unnamed protein product [Closterium sp. NIES-65]
MRAGADSKYLLFLDDDIQTHLDTLTLLVTAMEENPNALVCTGDSFDFPGPDPRTRRNLAAYAAMAYRVPVQLAMASGGKQLPEWGGCMMIRLDDLRADRYGMLTASRPHSFRHRRDFNSSAAMALILANASLFLALLYLSLLSLATFAVIRLFHTTFSLCNLLSPEKPSIRLGSLSLMLGVAGMLVDLAVVPIVSVYTLLEPAITWAGITYVRRRGLIVKVRHPQHPQVGQQQQHRQERDGVVKGEREEIKGMEEAELEKEDAEEEQQ